MDKLQLSVSKSKKRTTTAPAAAVGGWCLSAPLLFDRVPALNALFSSPDAPAFADIPIIVKSRHAVARVTAPALEDEDDGVVLAWRPYDEFDSMGNAEEFAASPLAQLAAHVPPNNPVQRLLTRLMHNAIRERMLLEPRSVQTCLLSCRKNLPLLMLL